MTDEPAKSGARSSEVARHFSRPMMERAALIGLISYCHGRG